MGAPQDFGQMAGYLRLTGKWRLELPGGEFIQRAEPPAKFGRTQAALPVQPAQKFFGGPACQTCTGKNARLSPWTMLFRLPSFALRQYNIQERRPSPL
jgi:hypothetical protein